MQASQFSSAYSTHSSTNSPRTGSAADSPRYREQRPIPQLQAPPSPPSSSFEIRSLIANRRLDQAAHKLIAAIERQLVTRQELGQLLQEPTPDSNFFGYLMRRPDKNHFLHVLHTLGYVKKVHSLEGRLTAWRNGERNLSLEIRFVRQFFSRHPHNNSPQPQQLEVNVINKDDNTIWEEAMWRVGDTFPASSAFNMVLLRFSDSGVYVWDYAQQKLIIVSPTEENREAVERVSSGLVVEPSSPELPPETRSTSFYSSHLLEAAQHPETMLAAKREICQPATWARILREEGRVGFTQFLISRVDTRSVQGYIMQYNQEQLHAFLARHGFERMHSAMPAATSGF